jgi:hypothetical protein
VKRLAPLPLLALVLLVAGPAHAAPPPNDREEGAAALELNQPVAGDYAEATNDYTLSGSTCFTGSVNTPSLAAGPDLVYRFVAPSAGTYVFRFRHSGSIDPVVYTAAFLPSGPAPQVVTGCGDAANRNAVQASEETRPAGLAAGQAIFVVADATGAAPPASSFQLLAEQVDTESEPNATPATADAPACGVWGATTPAADVDFWSLGAHAVDSRVFALLDGAAGFGSNWDMRVTTPTDTVEYDDGNADFPFGNNAPAIGGAPLTGTAAYLRVNMNSAAVENEPYRLYSVVQPPIGFAGGEAEPNGATAQATSTTGYSSGALSSNADVDVFSFTAPARGRLFIALDPDPLRNNTPFNAGLALLDAAGAVVTTVDDPGSTSDTNPADGTLTSATPNSPAEALVVRVPAAGTYYVRVTASAAAFGDYLLSVSSSCRTGAPTAPIEISPAGVPDGAVGAPYGVTFAAGGGFGSHEFAVSGGSLPAGLSLAPGGALSGTPTEAGAFPFTVRATDSEGSVGTRDYTLTVAGLVPDTQAPVVTGFGVTNRVFAPVPVLGARASAVKRGTRWRFSLSEAASVVITVQKRAAGKRRGRRCVKPTPRLRNRRNCTRYVRAGRGRPFAGTTGANRRFFSGRFGRRALKPGRYRGVLVATDAAGNRSRAVRTSLRVRRP